MPTSLPRMPAQATVRVPIRWRDLDELGHVNQAVYHVFLEEARGALIDALGPDAFPFVLARVELDHRSEVRRDHAHVDAVAAVESVGRTSFVLAHSLVLPDGGVAAEGRCVCVAWDPQARAGREISEAERARLEGA